MSPDEKQALIEKIDELPPEQRKRVEGYVDALLKEKRSPPEETGEKTRAQRVQKTDSGRSEPPTSNSERPPQDAGGTAEKNARQQGSQERYLRQDWAGALGDLKDEYTSLELEEEIKKQWMRMVHD